MMWVLTSSSFMGRVGRGGAFRGERTNASNLKLGCDGGSHRPTRSVPMESHYLLASGAIRSAFRSLATAPLLYVMRWPDLENSGRDDRCDRVSCDAVGDNLGDSRPHRGVPDDQLSRFS